MGRDGAGARLAAAALAVAVAGCAAMTTEEAPATSVIRELTVTPSDGEAAGGTARVAADQRPPNADCAMLWPVDGALSSPFGTREGRNHEHEGIDVAVAEDTPVRAACDGVVAYAGNGLRGYGNVVIVRHAGQLATVYAHNRALEVHEGDLVRRGQVIARSGQTGHATAPHLHFEVRLGSIARNPLGYLSPQ